MTTFTHRDISLLYYRLEPYKGSIKHRFDLYREQAQSILDNEGGLDEFSKGYEKRGFIVDEKNGVRYTEWAPGVKEARLIGDFSECEDSESVSLLEQRRSADWAIRLSFASLPLFLRFKTSQFRQLTII